MKNVTVQEPPSSPCAECGAPIWLARFGQRWRAVELAPLTYRIGRPRPSGKVALSFPLIPGGDVLGAVVRKLTRYRLHVHGRRPSAYVPPTVEPVGNLNDVLASTCGGGR